MSQMAFTSILPAVQVFSKHLTQTLWPRIDLFIKYSVGIVKLGLYVDGPVTDHFLHHDDIAAFGSVVADNGRPRSMQQGGKLIFPQGVDYVSQSAVPEVMFLWFTMKRWQEWPHSTSLAMGADHKLNRSDWQGAFASDVCWAITLSEGRVKAAITINIHTD